MSGVPSATLDQSVCRYGRRHPLPRRAPRSGCRACRGRRLGSWPGVARLPLPRHHLVVGSRPRGRAAFRHARSRRRPRRLAGSASARTIDYRGRVSRPGNRNSEGRAMFSDAQIASLEGDLAEHHVKRGGGPVNQCATSRAGTPSPRPTESSASAAGPARRSSSSSSGAASARSTPRRRGPARDTPAATSPASASPCWARACAFCATAQESATAPTITRARRMRAPSSRPRRTPPSGRSLPSAARSGWRSTANRWRPAGRRQKRPPSGRRRPRDRRGDGGGVRSR